MSLNFPNNPSINDTYTIDTKTWKWNGYAWELVPEVVIGSQGAQGLQGTQGTQGTQGLQGSQGLQGLQGLSNQGVQGTQGLQGTQGTQGLQGLQGLQGPAGPVGAEFNISGIVTLLFEDDVESSGTSTNTSVKTYSLAANDFTSIIAEAEVTLEQTGTNNTSLDVAILYGATTLKTMTINHVGNNANDGGKIALAIKTTDAFIAGGNITLSITQTGVGTWRVEGFRVYAVDTYTFGAGAQGLQGLSNQGVQGTQGTQGTQGLQGLQGDQGTQGTQGLQGLQGTQGNQGLQGLQGTQGNQGLQGLQGEQGLQGLQGEQGVQGLQGTQGVGSQGVQGTQGLQGEQGVQGLQGVQGVQGDQGIQGLSNQGIQGLSGLFAGQGTQGLQGTQGIGEQGLQGLQGTIGPTASVPDQSVILTNISGSFNGSTTQFTISDSSGNFINSEIDSAARLLISVGGIVQQPDPTQSAGFYISGGTDRTTDPIKINFVEAPKAGQAFFGVAIKSTNSPTTSFITAEQSIAYSITFGV